MAGWLFARGHAADVILGVMLIEGLVLTAVMRWPVATVFLRLLPGALMIGALRLALTGAGWHWIVVMLGLSFPAHPADLWLNRPAWRRPLR